jgi:hypothetical protein
VWVELEQTVFKDYSSWFDGKYCVQTTDITGERYSFTNAVHFNFGIGERVDTFDGDVKTYSHPGTVWVRQTMDPREEPKEVSFLRDRDGASVALCESNLKPINRRPIAPNENTRKGLKKLMPYLSPNGRRYYQKIIGQV